MTDSISKMVAALLAVLLLYIYPAAEAASRQDELSQLTVYNTVTRFVDAVRTKGYLTPTMYDEFHRELSLTGNTYNIELEHLHKKYVPEYTDPSNQTEFTGKFDVVMDGYYNEQIMPVLYPDNELPVHDSSRRYILTSGDSFRVAVQNTNRTPAVIFQEWLHFGAESASKVAASYGGMVLNEDY
ncbi:hypothetical protein [Paenibacillus sp. Marseille-Q4541]|uniref:hypothetical protein n=1 Tax=Paenibacillus sp. Marseille-Q4541 TaxID=2831522 RepID=UPI001BA61D69|nr:hypothetical protein [Paenibacillus sp. Marseille-Q4541]